MPNWKKVIVSGSAGELSSLFAPSITGSLLGTASYATTASLPLLGIVTASSDMNQISFTKGDGSSFNILLSTGSVESASYSATASYVLPLQQDVIITGSLLLTGSHISTVDYIDFTILPVDPIHQEGRIHWIDDTKTLNIDTDVNNFYVEVGHQNVVRGRNTNSFTLTKGTIVYINGESGNRPTFATASWEGDPTSASTLGFVAQDIASSQTGYVISMGLLHNIDTTAYTPGTQLYLSSSGQYTSVVPISPLHEVRLGKTITQALDGTIYVDIMNGYEFGELHDVLITSASTGDLVLYNSASRVWENTKQLTGSYAITGSLVITGSSNSTLFRVGTNDLVVTGSRIGIGTTTPVDAVEIVGYSKYIKFAGTSETDRSAWIGNDSSGTGNVYLFNGTNTNSVFITGNGSSFLNGGNVGIGIIQSSISASLHISGTNAATLLRLDAPGSSSILFVTGSGRVGIGTLTPSSTLNVAGTTTLSGSANTISGSILTVIGSGSTQPVFTVQGSQGELFSVTDSLSGSLFSVNDISGLPILEVFSDNTTLIGNYLDPMLITTAKVTQTNSGSFTVYSLPTASYDTAFFEYSVKSGSNARAGTIMAIQSGNSVNFTETTTTDFGNTSAISFAVIVTGSNMALTGSSTSGAWTIKSIVRGL